MNLWYLDLRVYILICWQDCQENFQFLGESFWPPRFWYLDENLGEISVRSRQVFGWWDCRDLGEISVKILQGLSNYLIPIRLIKSLCKCGTISVEGLIRWLWMKLTPYFYREYITHDKSQFYSKITYNCKEINLNKKFWSWCNNRNIISTFIKNLIFTKEIDCHSTSSKTDAKTN